MDNFQGSRHDSLFVYSVICCVTLTLWPVSETKHLSLPGLRKVLMSVSCQEYFRHLHFYFHFRFPGSLFHNQRILITKLLRDKLGQSWNCQVEFSCLWTLFHYRSRVICQVKAVNGYFTEHVVAKCQSLNHVMCPSWWTECHDHKPIKSMSLDSIDEKYGFLCNFPVPTVG